MAEQKYRHSVQCGPRTSLNDIDLLDMAQKTYSSSKAGFDNYNWCVNWATLRMYAISTGLRRKPCDQTDQSKAHHLLGALGSDQPLSPDVKMIVHCYNSAHWHPHCLCSFFGTERHPLYIQHQYACLPNSSGFRTRVRTARPRTSQLAGYFPIGRHIWSNIDRL